jgi:hypothetical protein
MSKSWRDALAIHPAAELFPRMSEAELAALAEDIKANGLKSPIVLWSPESKNPPRYVLDGINRLDAMERADIQFLTDRGEPIGQFFQTKWEKKPLTIDQSRRIKKGEHVEPQSDTDPYAYVVSANIHRRHLTAEQKRDLIAKLIKATPDKSDRQIAETVKASPTTVGAVRTEMEAKGDVSKLDTRTDRRGRKQPRRKPRGPNAAEQAAKEAGRILGRLERADEAVQRDFIRPPRRGRRRQFVRCRAVTDVALGRSSMKSSSGHVFTLKFVPLPRVDAIKALRGLLKVALRRFGLRRIEVSEIEMEPEMEAANVRRSKTET